jgi:hypothetical protein
MQKKEKPSHVLIDRIVVFSSFFLHVMLFAILVALVIRNDLPRHIGDWQCSQSCSIVSQII